MEHIIIADANLVFENDFCQIAAYFAKLVSARPMVQ